MYEMSKAAALNIWRIIKIIHFVWKVGTNIGLGLNWNKYLQSKLIYTSTVDWLCTVNVQCTCTQSLPNNGSKDFFALMKGFEKNERHTPKWIQFLFSVWDRENI